MTSLSRILVGTGCTSLECPWHPARDAFPCWTRLVRGRLIPAGGVLDGLLLRRPNTNAPRTEGHGGRSAWRRLVILRLPLSPSNSKDRSPAREGCTPLRAVLMRRLIGRPRLAWGPRRRRPAPSRKVSERRPESIWAGGAGGFIPRTGDASAHFWQGSTAASRRSIGRSEV